ncbi:hypothetical protein L917_02771 [Phytophthora nicotianae]|uniref:Uncharacterized protein n=1 Tax=Phytophthora nicotianae TaxID=4792 RepID=W2LV51_PHYNI|nr:hypothetical protein L917_02771 [Phytophthora nicotianae]
MLGRNFLLKQLQSSSLDSTSASKYREHGRKDGYGA